MRVVILGLNSLHNFEVRLILTCQMGGVIALIVFIQMFQNKGMEKIYLSTSPDQPCK